MGPPPAVVIVVRHGARLDQADKQWHLKSPTPYDPPLTYGGWTQCRALGARIAELLQTREHIFEATHHDEELGNGTSGNVHRTGRRGRPRRKKHRVIVHSSPFLRCVQTSIAISSGISQFNGLNGSSRGHQPRRSRGETSQERPDLPRLSTIDDEDGDSIPRSIYIPKSPNLGPGSGSGSGCRTKLRLDAFLGEWLSPEYYESITPPPDSVLMLAGAKSELLHRGEPIAVEEQQQQQQQPRPSSARPRVSSSAGLWGSPTLGRSPADSEDEHSLAEMDFLPPGINPPVPRERSASHGAQDLSPTSPRLSKRGFFTPRSGYTPPTPLYSVSPYEPIPQGYVAHARDHCVDVDFQWDSMRPPQNWGDGGQYGEEWSSMHRRFRYGLNSMVNWYRHHVESSHQLHGHLRTLHPPKREEEEDDEDADTVLVLVTHSAGCNALIGALTNQPVLIDIPMSSLTMAVRRERPLSPPPPQTNSNGRKPSLTSDSTLAHEYEVSLTASTDHFRPGSASSSSSSLPAPVDMPMAMKAFMPGAVQRSNTLPIRHSAPPTRHISPSSRNRSTSSGKMTFHSSPLNPNPGGSPPSPLLQQKTWLESHKPQPQKSWMDAHKQQRQTPPSPEAKGGLYTPPHPGLLRSDSSSPGTGLWQAKASSSSAGLWERPEEITKSGVGTAVAVEKQPWQPPKDPHKPVGWLGHAPKLNTNLAPSTPDRKASGANSPKSDTKSVKFAESVKADDEYDDEDDDDDDDEDHSVSPRSRSTDHSGTGDSVLGQDEIDEALANGLDEQEIARLSKAPSADVRIRELGTKRRWTMNDERNQDREGDWRFEEWM